MKINIIQHFFLSCTGDQVLLLCYQIAWGASLLDCTQPHFLILLLFGLEKMRCSRPRESLGLNVIVLCAEILSTFCAGWQPFTIIEFATTWLGDEEMAQADIWSLWLPTFLLVLTCCKEAPKAQACHNMPQHTVALVFEVL